MTSCKFPTHVKGLNVVGRDDDKKAVFRFLLDNPVLADYHGLGRSGVPSIAIVGRDGIGKTTLAQLVYNDQQVLMNFKSRWWASISVVSDEKEILVRILRCIRTTGMNEKVHGLSISDLYVAVKESMNSGGKYLLVLDDVPDGDLDFDGSFYSRIMPILKCGTIESRIIITTRSTKFVFYRGVGQLFQCLALEVVVDQIHELHRLTKEESWQLCNLTANLSQKEISIQERESLTRKVVQRSYGIPLKIKTIASLLSTADTIHDKILSVYDTMSLLRLSYNKLPSFLKPCLAYCSLFPKDYIFQTEELINLWISQGLVPLSDFRFDEKQGYKYFAELLDRVFFQEATVGECGEVVSCKMHGAMHDLMKSLAEDESCILTKQNSAYCGSIRHVSVGYEMDSSWIIPPSLYPPPPLPCVGLDLQGFEVDPPPPLCSFLSFCGGSISPLVLDELLTEFELLRALKLRHQEIKVVPSSIGMLQHLRYLDLSHNKFRYLPNSIVLLVNLLTLDISWCQQLELLPVKFAKMYSLRHLDTENCCRLRYMPPDFGQLTHLQRLSLFKVGEPIDDGKYSRLHVLSGLQLSGKLEVKFDEDAVWDENDRLELPIGITLLTITNYPGMRLLPSILSNLVSLHIGPSSKIKQIWLLRSLTSLKTLRLSYLEQLEYIETEEGETSAPFFFSLKVLALEGLPKLMGWSREVEAAFTCHESIIGHISCPDFPQLSELTVRCCRQLKLIPLCPKLQTLELNDVNHMLITNLLLSTSFHVSSSLESIAVWDCDLQAFPGGNLTSLHHLDLRHCYKLEDLQLPPPVLNNLKQLEIQSCPELELWEEKKKKKRGVDWDSLPGLCELTLVGMPMPDQLPACLQQCQALCKLLDRLKENKKRNTFGLCLRGCVQSKK